MGWRLEEVGRPWCIVVADCGTTMKAREDLAIHPGGKDPAVLWRGVTVLECAAWTRPDAGSG